MGTLAHDIDAPPPEEIDLSEATVSGRTPWQLFWSRFRRDRFAFVGLGIIVVMIILALTAPLWAKLVGHGPNDTYQLQMTTDLGLPKGPNGDFWFGADLAGRDLFVRTIYGARVSILIGVVATGISVAIGVVLGILAGYRGGWLDTLISRVADIILSMPLILFGIGIVAACSTSAKGCLNGLLQPGLTLVVLIIVVFTWPIVARLVRGNTLSLREKEFVEANRSLGAGEFTIMFREILPNLVAPLIVYASLLVPTNILFEAYLSFLGLGVPQRTPSWGGILSDATDVLDTAWWFWVFPGIFLVLTVLAFNVLGDGLRDALDPRSGR